MKSPFFIRANKANWIPWIIAFSCLIGCKKNLQRSNSPFESKFSFSYKGVKYILPYREGTATEWTASEGIMISLPDIFNGVIHYPYENCAWLAPADMIIGTMIGNCRLSYNGGEIDSVSVFTYKSGHYEINYKNCIEEIAYDPYSDTRYSYSVCDADGTFELTLKNKEGKEVIITEGEFELYSFVR